MLDLHMVTFIAGIGRNIAILEQLFVLLGLPMKTGYSSSRAKNLDTLINYGSNILPCVKFTVFLFLDSIFCNHSLLRHILADSYLSIWTDDTEYFHYVTRIKT